LLLSVFSGSRLRKQSGNVPAGSGYLIAHSGFAPSLGTGFGRSFFGWVLGCVRTGLSAFGNGLRLWFLALSLSCFGSINNIASGTVSVGGGVLWAASGKFVHRPEQHRLTSHSTLTPQVVSA
jgi:hypothetical protein